MIHIIMSVIAFFLVLPLLIYLPIGLTMKGKLVIALQCLAVAIGAIVLFPYVPIWQTGLLVFLVLFFAGYFTVKYGAINWAIDSGTVWEEEHEREFAFIEPLREEMKQPYEMPVMDEMEEVIEPNEPAVPASESVKEEEDDYLESLFYGEQDGESEMDAPSIPNEESHYLEELFNEVDDDEDTDIPLLHFDDKGKL
ncbi:hypothetical protein [Domibacillus aminovorans]|uniref:Uncharacterized protein n=1 Tax=Domibacillus aminovorans TaxID=29332 RepID=A0A177LAF6_9BACI|nr:hypothetical protein [Domibacillus aminovorans]OAH62708.1 hypothetical protein AWH49_08560 [Domibacillus aminovorans]